MGQRRSEHLVVLIVQRDKAHTTSHSVLVVEVSVLVARAIKGIVQEQGLIITAIIMDQEHKNDAHL
jgi:hypothetical protein